MAGQQPLTPLTPQHWPSPAPLLWQQDIIVVQLTTPHSTDRREARARVRTAITELLAPVLDCPAGDISLQSIPGQPLRLVLPAKQPPISISVSHEPGLSLLALHRGGPVGIDLMASSPAPDWQQDIPLLAQDYLGPAVAAALAALPASARVQAFATHWTRYEAGLKTLGKGLEEWSPALGQALAALRYVPLAVPAAYVASLALGAGQH